ncbi:DUF3108 domain-containing protein [Zavarzinia sp.]|uniref:DUF3108 domain-containing protein n=1 Tax=Zavarzinia sp. TaxID=2027920 RepID=UPI0035672EE8
MSVVRRIALLATLMMFPAAGAGQAGSTAPGQVALTYRVFLGGVPVVEVDTRTIVDAQRYRMDSLTRTIGLWEGMFKARMQSRVDGVLAGSKVEPLLYQIRYDGRVGKRRSIDVTFGDNGPTMVHTVPDNAEDGRKPVEPEFLVGAIDPASAAIMATSASSDGELCHGGYKIFDGRRRYDVAFDNQGADTLDGHGDFYSGEALHCQVQYRRVKGFDPDWERSEAKKFPNTIDVWFVRLPGLPRAVPVKVAVNTEFGVVVAQMVDHVTGPGESLGDAAYLPPPDRDKMGG